jgi:hypothetical protein
MAGLFPGMDPFLEKPGFWQEFHNSFIALLNIVVNRELPSRFLSHTQVRMIQDEDEFRREAYLEILDRTNRSHVVMVIELLSPENKRGQGREEYLRKQQAVLQSQAHLLEIDLLRGGGHTVAAPKDGALALGSYAYLLSLANAHELGKILLWRIGLADRLPTLELPLTADVPPFTLDLQAVFERCYDENRYAELLEVAYTQPAEPAFTADEATWAQECLEAYQNQA